MFCGSSSWCRGLVCSVLLWYFLIILTYFSDWSKLSPHSSFMALKLCCHFPIGILGQVWYLIVSIPNLCTLTYLEKLFAHSCKQGKVYLYTAGEKLQRNKQVPTICTQKHQSYKPIVLLSWDIVNTCIPRSYATEHSV